MRGGKESGVAGKPEIARLVEGGALDAPTNKQADDDDDDDDDADDKSVYEV